MGLIYWRPERYGSGFRITPNNRFICWGYVLLVTTVLLWIGTELTKRIGGLLPYGAGVGVHLIMGGFVCEIRQNRIGGSLPPSDPKPPLV
jgi:hypothetical protein